MKKKELIEQLISLEKAAPNDFELGGLLREFVINNFKSPKNKKTKKNKHDRKSGKC